MEVFGLISIGYQPIESVINRTLKDSFPFVRVYKSPDRIFGTLAFFKQEALEGRLHGLTASF